MILDVKNFVSLFFLKKNNISCENMRQLYFLCFFNNFSGRIPKNSKNVLKNNKTEILFKNVQFQFIKTNPKNFNE